MHSLDQINQITRAIIGAGFSVHNSLGPGLLESSYKACVAYKLSLSGITVEKEMPLPLIYKEVKLEVGYRIDLLVARTVIVEIKAVEALTDVHVAQILTYMKLTGTKVGLLINFIVKDMKKGIKRLIL